jgi:hypothetical protein
MYLDLKSNPTAITNCPIEILPFENTYKPIKRTRTEVIIS